MAVALAPVPGGVLAAHGYRAATVSAGIRYNRDDLLLLVADEPCAAAGVFTTNKVAAWCVEHNRKRLALGPVQAIVVNAGNANCANGPSGQRADWALEAATRREVGLAPDAGVLTASTGVIGREFPIEHAEIGIAHAARSLARDSATGERCAKAIMTTDTVPKSFAVEVPDPAGSYRVGGICKGSGMIAPNMATMLAFLTTDASIAPQKLQPILERVVARTFNCVTVDGDTSTNDMAILLARPGDGEPPAGFETALLYVCTQLAKKLARDGEGATKLVTVYVSGCAGDARRVARTIAESPLVKTALFGNDPNWGRILAAAGRSGEPIDMNQAVVRIGGVEVFRHGAPTKEDLKLVSFVMKADEVRIELDLGHPEGSAATFWTCDYSVDYVKINADYTT